MLFHSSFLIHSFLILLPLYWESHWCLLFFSSSPLSALSIVALNFPAVMLPVFVSNGFGLIFPFIWYEFIYPCILPKVLPSLCYKCQLYFLFLRVMALWRGHILSRAWCFRDYSYCVLCVLCWCVLDVSSFRLVFCRGSPCLQLAVFGPWSECHEF